MSFISTPFARICWASSVPVRQWAHKTSALGHFSWNLWRGMRLRSRFALLARSFRDAPLRQLPCCLPSFLPCLPRSSGSVSVSGCPLPLYCTSFTEDFLQSWSGIFRCSSTCTEPEVAALRKVYYASSFGYVYLHSVPSNLHVEMRAFRIYRLSNRNKGWHAAAARASSVAFPIPMPLAEAPSPFSLLRRSPSLARSPPPSLLPSHEKPPFVLAAESGDGDVTQHRQ